jgi:hypothetical protein
MKYDRSDAFIAKAGITKGGGKCGRGWIGIKGSCKRGKAGDQGVAAREFADKQRAARYGGNASPQQKSKMAQEPTSKASMHPALAKKTGEMVRFRGKPVAPAKTTEKAKKTSHGMSRASMLDAIAKKYDTDAAGVGKSKSFKMATSGMGKLDIKKKGDLERIYRKTVGILPGEDKDSGPGVVNGINIHNYDMPWKVFALDPKKATSQDIKSAYRKAALKYHPDRAGGDAKTFDRLTEMYKSITQKF